MTLSSAIKNPLDKNKRHSVGTWFIHVGPHETLFILASNQLTYHKHTYIYKYDHITYITPHFTSLKTVFCSTTPYVSLTIPSAQPGRDLLTAALLRWQNRGFPDHAQRVPRNRLRLHRHPTVVTLPAARRSHVAVPVSGLGVTGCFGFRAKLFWCFEESNSEKMMLTANGSASFSVARFEAVIAYRINMFCFPLLL